MDNDPKIKIRNLVKESLSISKIALTNATNYLNNCYANYNQKKIEEQKQKQSQLQIQMKQNEIIFAQNLMSDLAQQTAPAFYRHKYEYLEPIRKPADLRLENYKYQNNIWLLRYSIDKSCDIPINQEELKILRKKMSQDLTRYVQELVYNNPQEILQFNYCYIICNPTLYNITDVNHEKKIFLDIKVFL